METARDEGVQEGELATEQSLSLDVIFNGFVDSVDLLLIRGSLCSTTEPAFARESVRRLPPFVGFTAAVEQDTASAGV